MATRNREPIDDLIDAHVWLRTKAKGFATVDAARHADGAHVARRLLP
jgi:hypothetical protein